MIYIYIDVWIIISRQNNTTMNATTSVITYQNNIAITSQSSCFINWKVRYLLVPTPTNESINSISYPLCFILLLISTLIQIHISNSKLNILIFRLKILNTNKYWCEQNHVGSDDGRTLHQLILLRLIYLSSVKALQS